jgi:methylase of polypeptide subunit release factors
MKSFAKGTSLKAPVRLVAMVHAELHQHVGHGDTVVDATVGNGYDTLALAEWVGASGRVIGFDIESKAIASAREKLASLNLLDRVQLHCDCHSQMGQYVTTSVAAIVFNLGYLPGSDHARITHASTTLAAMESALPRLKPNGVLSVVAYPGHAGGEEERDAVAEWMNNQSKNDYTLKSIIADPISEHSPEWFLLQR